MKPYWRIKKKGKWTWVPAIRAVGAFHPLLDDRVAIYKPLLEEEE